MNHRFDSIEAAIASLSTPSSPDWADAFSFLAQYPDTAPLILDTFAETLEQMGVTPTGSDPSTGEPVFSLADVARAIGIPESELEAFSANSKGR